MGPSLTCIPPVGLCVCVCVCTHDCIQMYVHARMCARVHVCMYISVYTCVCVCIYAYVHTRTKCTYTYRSYMPYISYNILITYARAQYTLTLVHDTYLRMCMIHAYARARTTQMFSKSFRAHVRTHVHAYFFTGKKFGKSTAWRLAVECAMGYQELHNKGFMHRDIKSL
jgi:hypothetical protein